MKVKEIIIYAVDENGIARVVAMDEMNNKLFKSFLSGMFNGEIPVHKKEFQTETLSNILTTDDLSEIIGEE